MRTLTALVLVSAFGAPGYGQGAPPVHPSILILTAELVGLRPDLDESARLEAEMDAERGLWDAGSLPENFINLAAIEGRPAPYDFPNRLDPDVGPTVVLTLLDRDRREVRALLEQEGVGTEHYLTVRLNRVSRPAEGKLIVELSTEGVAPRWLRIFLRRL